MTLPTSPYRSARALPRVLVVAFNSHVIGVDPTSGLRVWYWTPLPAVSVFAWRVAITGDHVLVAGGDLVACLAYDTGKELWRRTSPVGARTLLVEGDRFFLAGSGDLAAFELETGKLLWHEPFKGHGHGAVALAFPGNVVQADETS